MKWADGNAGGIMINGDVYTLQQGHWHTPSEHTLDDKRYTVYPSSESCEKPVLLKRYERYACLLD